ncbi:hypothetical protein MTO96_001701 [Rhipicephalus appendiculatus]
MESVGSLAGYGHMGQKALKPTAIQEESSFTDKEAFRMPNGSEASTERSSTHIKVTDSVNSERPKERNFVAPETNISQQKSLSGIASSTAPMAIQVPLSSLSQVLSQQPLKVVKRKVVLETVTKTVTEKKESVKAVTNQATGIEHKDSHLESTTKEEVKSKREEETIESYESIANVRQGTVSNPIVAPITENKQAGIVSNPVLGCTTKAVESPKESVASHSAPDIKGVKEQTCQTPEKHKRPKQPVAIRVHDDTLAEDEEVASRKEEPGHIDLEPKSILKPLNRPEAHQGEESPPDKKHLGFQEAEKAETAPPQPVAGTKKDGDDDSEEAAQPPARFKFNRKDSIAVTKLRMMKQAEEFSEEEDDDKKGSDSFLASSAAADDRSGGRHPMFKPPVVIYNEEPQPASTADTVQSDKGVNASISQFAGMTQALIEVTGANASEQKSNITDNIPSKDTPGVAETKLGDGTATGEVEKSQNETRSARTLTDDVGESSNVTTSLEKRQGGTDKSFSDTSGGTAGGNDMSSSDRQEPPIKEKASFTKMLEQQNVDNADDKHPDNKTRGQGVRVFGTQDEEQGTGKSETHSEQSRATDLLPVFVNASQIQTQATVADEKAIMEPCINRSVKEVKNVENSIVTSETEEVFYYPKEKVTKKHISETKVITETRSYTEIVIEPNYSESSLMPAIPEENEQLPIAATSSREFLTDKCSGKEGSLSTEAKETEGFRAVALTSKALSREAAPKNTSEGRLALRSQIVIDDGCSPVARNTDSFQTLTDFAPYEPEQLLSIQSTGIQETTKHLDRVGDQTMVELPSSDFDTCKGIFDRAEDGLPQLRSASGSRTKDVDALSGPTELLSTAMDDMDISALETTRDIDSSVKRRPDVRCIPTLSKRKETTTPSSSHLSNKTKNAVVEEIYGTESDKHLCTDGSEKGTALVEENIFKTYGRLVPLEPIANAVLDTQPTEVAPKHVTGASTEKSSSKRETTADEVKMSTVLETDDMTTPRSSLPVATNTQSSADAAGDLVQQLSPEVTKGFEKLQEAFGVLLEDASYVSPSFEAQPMEVAPTSPLFLEHSARPIASTSIDASRKQPTKISTPSDSTMRYASSDISSREIR